MSHPYKTRSGGATVTIFVPYDCRNHCPFCINKKEYADCTGFSLDAILDEAGMRFNLNPLDAAALGRLFDPETQEKSE